MRAGIGVLMAAALARGDPAPAERKSSPPPGESPERAGSIHAPVSLPTTADTAGGLVIRAFARVQGDTLDAGIVVANRSLQPMDVDHGVCPVLRLYHAGPAAGAPVWRSDAPPPSLHGGGHATCIALGVHATIHPRQEYIPPELRMRVPVSRILGDSLPPGAYRATLLTDLGEAPGEVEAGVVELPGG